MGCRFAEGGSLDSKTGGYNLDSKREYNTQTETIKSINPERKSLYHSLILTLSSVLVGSSYVLMCLGTCDFGRAT